MNQYQNISNLLRQLEAENKELREALTLAYLKGKADENAEKLDATESEVRK